MGGWCTKVISVLVGNLELGGGAQSGVGAAWAVITQMLVGVAAVA
jgi:hypothetical protein